MTVAYTRPGLPTRHLKTYLDAFVRAYDYEGHLRRDPLHLVLRYPDPGDREVAGIVAACLAYGIVQRVLYSVEAALDRLGPHPAAFLADFDAAGRAERRLFRGFLHRMTGEVEMRALCHALGEVLRGEGSLEARFAQGQGAGEATIRSGLAHLVGTLRVRVMAVADDMHPARAAWHRRRIRFLLPSPDEGSACKRLNLWLRWMVRRSRPDRGAWTAAQPSQLVIPLDAHIVRLSTYLGFTRRATPDWKMAEEVTAALRALDPEDPMKYDFALCHLGISGECLRRHDDAVCPRCPIERACRL